ncbi:MAG: cyclic nucleotide-binding domain-containing protein [Myxococcota bacterium]
MQNVQELREYADQKLFEGAYPQALHAYALLVQLQPNDLDPRLRLADTLLAMGEVPGAAFVYTKLAQHAANAGYPLRALVAIKVLEALEPELGTLLDSFAGLYAKSSERLGRAVRLSLGDPMLALPGDIKLDDPPPAEELLPAAAKIGASLESIAAYPDKLPAIPLFSELPADAFAQVLKALKLQRRRPGETILAEGDEGTSFFVLARGTVDIHRTGENGEAIPLATLRDGAIFGEMAMVSAQPRTATVVAADDCDLLEFDKEALRAAASEVTTIATALDKFMRERLLSNLLATAPLFRPLDRKQRLDLVRRFTAHDVAAGTHVIREGEAGRGLFVLLSGEVDVWKRDEDEKVLLATLKPGDLFGEIALITDDATTATVTAGVNSTVLFLSRELFQKLVEALPEIRDYIENLGDERLMDTQIVVSATDLEELDVEDLILL